jgi:hypothetical protein
MSVMSGAAVEPGLAACAVFDVGVFIVVKCVLTA